MTRNLRASGFTIVELVVYTGIFALVLGMLAYVFWGMRGSLQGMERLDIFHDLRSASRIITQELVPASHLIFPPNDGKKYQHLFFLNRQNEVAAIFRNPQEQLVLLNCDRQRSGGSGAIQVLAQKARDFTVVRKQEKYVTFKIQMLDAKGFEFVIANGISLKNLAFP